MAGLTNLFGGDEDDGTDGAGPNVTGGAGEDGDKADTGTDTADGSDAGEHAPDAAGDDAGLLGLGGILDGGVFDPGHDDAAG